jgi:general secretion pathway protein E
MFDQRTADTDKPDEYPTGFHQSASAELLPLAPGVTREYLNHHRVCPLRFDRSGDLVVAVTGDSLLDSLDDLWLAYRRPTRSETVTPEEMDRCIQRVGASADRLLDIAERNGAAADDDTLGELGADVRDLANQPPVIRYVNLLVRDAYDAGASDIHLEATRGGGLVVRFRLDGVLSPAVEQPQSPPQAVISRIKLLAELDIAERRRPQDGRIRVRLEGRDLDLRVSTVPTLFGESVVIRLLDRGGRPVELESLGMPNALFRAVARIADQPHGMVVVTGPTGSGKTTTLYAALARRRAGSEKIITVEDPVEYELAGVAQVPVHRQAGVTMGSVLRSILRQDPDVIMVGEMRDTETAEVAIQAAMTGHLVFSTLHTTDAVTAVPRLIDLGVPDYLVAATLEAVLAQRLVRRVCQACREEYRPPREQVALVAPENTESVSFVRGRGCAVCRGTGYRGRLGIFELFILSEEIKDAVSHGARRSELAALAAKQGMTPLRADGWAKIRAGVTTVEEVVRVAIT